MQRNDTWVRYQESKEKFLKYKPNNLNAPENAEGNHVHTKDELRELQALPLKTKIAICQSRIRDWVGWYGIENVLCSVSGGKDSTVLYDITKKMYPEMQYVFVDTGLEYPQLREFVKEFDNVRFVYPRINFRDVIKRFGYPVFGKEIANCVHGARNFFKSIQSTEDSDNYWYNIADLLGMREERDVLDKKDVIYLIKTSAGNISDTDIPFKAKAVVGLIQDKQGKKSIYDKSRYLFMLDAPFEISDMCCDVMKKSPLHIEQHIFNMYPITGEMASESLLRTKNWLNYGCNGFNMTEPKSTPMAFFTEQDILLYIKLNNIKIASVYGDVVAADGTSSDDIDWEEQAKLFLFDNNRVTLKTTQLKRTGCCFCCFGIQYEQSPNRLERFKEISNPSILDFVLRGGDFCSDGLWRPDSRGLGFWFVLKWINIHGGFNITIPDIEKYEEKYGTAETRRHFEIYE